MEENIIKTYVKDGVNVRSKLFKGEHVFEGVHIDRFQQVNRSFFWNRLEEIQRYMLISLSHDISEPTAKLTFFSKPGFGMCGLTHE